MLMLPSLRVLLRPLIFCLVLTSSAIVRAEGVLVLGDSISAGYGLSDPNKGWVSLLREVLKTKLIEVSNASISGDTTQGGLSRIAAALERVKPAVVLVELGGNDGLRGVMPEATTQNLISIVERCQKAGARVLLLGMRIPPNYGKQYTERFAAIYPKVALMTQVPLVPFLLDNVGGNPELMQLDGIHPNEKAQPILMNAALKGLEPLLKNKSKSGQRLSRRNAGGQ